jgi:hypothetical protein
MLSKIIALCLLCAFVGRLVFRTKIGGLGKTGRSAIDVALVVMAIVYVVQVVPALVGAID